jgi:hypothetical protein
VEKYGRDRHGTQHNITHGMRFACWLCKSIGTHSEYVQRITLPRQQELHNRTTMLQLYVQCLTYLFLSLQIVLVNYTYTNHSVSTRNVKTRVFNKNMYIFNKEI